MDDDFLPLILAGIGAVLLVWARVRIARESDALGKIPRLVVRFVPFSEIVCFAGSWARVNVSAFLSLIGWVLLLPWAMQVFAGDAVRDLALFRAEGSAPRAEMAARQTSIDPARHAPFKAAKVAELRERLTGWHDGLQARRDALDPHDAAAVTRFNEEAIAYHAFLAVVREEAASWTPPAPIVPAATPEPARKEPVATPRPEPQFKPLGSPKPLPDLKPLPELQPLSAIQLGGHAGR
jgi:hypothetical protein